MTRSLRMAVLGTGHIARTMAGAIGHVEGLEVAGFVSRDPARAAQLATSIPGARALPSLADALGDPLVDAIYIANESRAHAGAAIAALDAGKPVLCEKPCGIDAAEVGRIAAAARRTGTLFMEAVATPFLPAVAAALAAAQAGELGPLRQFGAQFGYPATARSHPGCFAPIGGGVLLDRAVYLVTLARLALGPIDRTEAIVTCDAAGVDVAASLLLRHAGGAQSMLAASLIGELDNAMTIAGDRATAFVRAPLLTAEALAIRRHGTISRPAPGAARGLGASGLMRRAAALARTVRSRHLGYGASPYVHELAHFRDLVRAGRSESPVLPPGLSVEVAAILQAAREAGR